MRVLAIDPGRTVGFSTSGHVHGEMESDHFLRWLFHNVRQFDRVVVERFVPRRWDNDAVHTVEVIGAIKWLARKQVVAWVNPADRARTQSSVNTKVIKGRHARDAEAIRLWDSAYGSDS